MSKAYDELIAFLDKAIPMPAEVEVCCTGCGPKPVDRMVQLDEAGDSSSAGYYPYVCPDCGMRFSIDGYSSSALKPAKRRHQSWVWPGG